MGSYKDWHIPFTRTDITLQMALDSLNESRTDQLDLPLMIKLAENPKFSQASMEIFHGLVDMQQHDCIHILLGRGLRIMDEAFTIGFTMGSSKKVTNSEQNLYAFITKHLYPDVYKFTNHEMAVLKDGIKLAYISYCSPLDQFNFNEWLDQPIGIIRDAVGIEDELILAYYAVEQRRYPESPASQRLLPPEKKVVAF